MIRTLLILTLSFISLSIHAQIPNNSFEDWEDEYLYDDPTYYGTSNFFSTTLAGAPNVTKVDGINNTSAVRVESVNSLGGPLSGLLTNNFFNQGIAGGQPFTSKADTFSGYIRHDILPGDTGVIAIIFKNSGQIISTNFIPVIGTVKNWEHFEVELAPLPLLPDSMLFIVQSSTDNIVAGSFLELDQLRFNGTDQLMNNDFEIWREIRYVDPVEWTSLNFFNALYGDKQSVSKSDDAYEGDWAARIESTWSRANNDTTGLLYSSDQFNGVDGFPITEKPAALRGYYKYFPIIPTDFAFAAIEFRFPDISANKRKDTIFILPLKPIMDYTQFELDLTGVTIPRPDTAKIYFLSSDAIVQGSRAGSVLFVDKLDFIPFTDVTSIKPIETLNIYPNPVVETIHINSSVEEGTYVIYNSKGKVFMSGEISNSKQDLNVHQLPTGNYNIAIYGDSNAIGSFIKIK